MSGLINVLVIVAVIVLVVVRQCGAADGIPIRPAETDRV